MRLPISVFIITKNEEDRIHYAINSVYKWADEVIVIDSGSADNTVEIAKQTGAKTVYNEWQGYGPQKIFGESLCKNDWVLNIDADEEISRALIEEIKDLFTHNKLKAAYRLNIKILMRFEKTPHRFAPSTKAIRLYNKNFAGFKDSSVHDSVVIKPDCQGETGHLRQPVIHRCFRSYTHAVEKINFYTSMQAKDMLTRRISPSIFRIITEPFTAFLKAYFLRRYCIYGVVGFIESVIYAFSRTLRLAKAYEGWLNKKK